MPEVCPCLEHFSKEIIEQAIEGKEDSYPSLAQAVSWTRPPDKLGTTLKGAAAEEQLQKLRAWAEEHKEITIPHPKAALILDLIDNGMIAFATVPGTGLVLRAKSAKEEFSRFIVDLNRRYKHDDSTILTMLCFAYGVVSWKFDPVELHRYERGRELIEINTKGYDLLGIDGRLQGDREDIADVLRKALGVETD